MRYRALGRIESTRNRKWSRGCQLILLGALQGMLWLLIPTVQARDMFEDAQRPDRVDTRKRTRAPADELSWEFYQKGLDVPKTQWVEENAPIDPEDIELQRRVDRALEVEARNGGRDSDRVAMLLSFRAQALNGQHQWRASLEDFQHADTLLHSVPHSERHHALMAYPAAGALQQLHRIPEAIALLQQSLESLRTSVPAVNYLYADSLDLLGHLYCQQKDCRTTGLGYLLKV